MRSAFSLSTLALLVALVVAAPRSEIVPTFRVHDPPGPSSAGRVFTLSLPSAPFPHEARDGGYEVDKGSYSRDEHYADSRVTVYLPRGYKAAGRLDLVFFFHGWMSSREEAESDFSLFDQFDRSGVRALLVIPETAVHSPDSFGGKFEDRGGFERFVGDLLGTLDARGIVPGAWPGSIALAGHSGGYRVIAKILDRGGLRSQIRECWLFDALYAGSRSFADWIVERRSGAGSGGARFINVSTRGGDTDENAMTLVDTLRARGIKPLVVGEDLGLDAVTLASPVIFLESDSDHFGVVRDRDEFRRFLSTSPALGQVSDKDARIAEGASTRIIRGRQ